MLLFGGEGRWSWYASLTRRLSVPVKPYWEHRRSREAQALGKRSVKVMIEVPTLKGLYWSRIAGNTWIMLNPNWMQRTHNRAIGWETCRSDRPDRGRNRGERLPQAHIYPSLNILKHQTYIARPNIYVASSLQNMVIYSQKGKNENLVLRK